MVYFNNHNVDPMRYVAYYQNQAGNGLPGYAGGGVMYGAGLGGLFRGLFRMAIPLLRRGFSIAKPHLKSTAKNILSDVVSNTLSRSFNNNHDTQDGSGLMVMARKSVPRPPGVRRSGQKQKKTKQPPKKTSVVKRKRKETAKRSASKRSRSSVKTIF